MAVMTLIDADTLDVNEIERKRQLVTDGLKDLPESWPYHVAVAIPESESWVDLKRRGPSETVREDIMRIDWETIAKHNQEVAEVISFVERVS